MANPIFDHIRSFRFLICKTGIIISTSDDDEKRNYVAHPQFLPKENSTRSQNNGTLRITATQQGI